MNASTEKARSVPTLVRPLDMPESNSPIKELRYTFWSPTCDEVDCIAGEITMDCEVKVGDWLEYEKMGGRSSMIPIDRKQREAGYGIAYRVATSTTFNTISS